MFYQKSFENSCDVYQCSAGYHAGVTTSRTMAADNPVQNIVETSKEQRKTTNTAGIQILKVKLGKGIMSTRVPFRKL